MNNTTINRSELLFLYDIKDANPNGDPLDENKPRIDEETGINIVTDVRLKRTIRDYLYNFKGFNGEGGKDIFIREISSIKGIIQTGKGRAKDFKDNKDKILNECIDVRLFGGTIPLEKASITFTGPVQFKMGRSLHPVVVYHIKGTGAFAADEKKKHRTFREEDFVAYSLIAFHGIVNENAGRFTNLTNEDVNLLIEALWKGTKNLISRSKFGQNPRLLLKIDYKEKDFFIGDLDRLIQLKSDLNYRQIRDIADYKIDISNLVQKLDINSSKIDKLSYMIDDRLLFEYNGNDIKINEISNEIRVEEIKL